MTCVEVHGCCRATKYIALPLSGRLALQLVTAVALHCACLVILTPVWRCFCRVLGALLSAHLLIVDPEKPFGELDPGRYDGELAGSGARSGLPSASGLRGDGHRPAAPASQSQVQLPHPRVSLRY